MTSRSRRKRQTTAPTFKLAKPVRLATISLIICISATAASDALAQHHPTSNRHLPAGQMRPVPRIGHEQPNARPQSNPKPSGWNLQWRGDGQLRPVQGQINLRPVGSPTRRPASSQYRSEVAQVQNAQLQAPEVRMAQAQGSPSQGTRSRSTQNFFDDPFGDDPINKQRQVPTATQFDAFQPDAAQPDASRMNAAQADEDFGNLFGNQPEAEMPAPSDLPSQTDPQSGNSLRGENPFRDPAPTEQLPVPSAEEVSPVENAPGADKPDRGQFPDMPSQPEPSPSDRDPGPSIKDLLENERPDDVESDRSTEDEAMDDDDLEDDDSDDDDVDYDNPFNDREADEEDRDRLNSGEDSDSDFDSEDFGADSDGNDVAGISCDEFRQAIRQQTIDQVSLDISDPYRPDEIDLARYQKLKNKFDEKQSVRVWRNVSGTPLATGRLRDLAYEKAVIETEFGALQALPMDRLSEADHAYISEEWGIPNSCLLEQVAYTPRSWTPATLTWKASNACHNPLYFEDVNLERYGHTHGPVLEPLVQTAHFFGNIAVLPYKMGVHHPTECQYSLGYYRPGNCAPWIKPPVPISLQGAYNQAAVVTGLFWLIP